MAKTLSQAERQYFLRKVGSSATATMPLNNLKRIYFYSQVSGTNANTPFSELETDWMIKVISTAGLTITNDKSNSDLWRLMVLAIGQIPATKIEQNKLIFYVNAP